LAKKVVDTWKTKQWYQIYAPELFGNKVVGEVIASEDRQLLNRVINVNLSELTGDYSQIYTHVKLRIVDVKGKNAYTRFIGHELPASFIKTFIRRRRTIVDDVIDIKTADNKTLRIKTIVFTSGKIARDTEAAIRTALRKELAAATSKLTLDGILTEMFFKKFAVKFIEPLKKFAPIKRVEFRKTEVKETFT
jgi:small subunit ribosomal protein S3Ae